MVTFGLGKTRRVAFDRVETTAERAFQHTAKIDCVEDPR